MFLVYDGGKLLNLDHVTNIDVVEFEYHSYSVLAYFDNGKGDDIIRECKSRDVALVYIADIADALALGKSVYMVGTNPKSDERPSGHYAIERNR